MKKTILTILLCASTVLLCAQSQTINGNLDVTGNVTAKNDVNVGLWTVAGKTGLGSKLNFGGVDLSGDFIWMAKYTKANEQNELRVNIGDDGGSYDMFSVGHTDWSDASWRNWFVVSSQGVAIRKLKPSCALDVNGAIMGDQLDINGTIRSKEVKIEATGWSDFVFDENYNLPSLSEVESHIKENKHLPNIPSEKEVLKDGINVVEMQAKLLQKIEELTLYVIEQDKKIENQNKEIQDLKERVKEN